jgi:hypothetical protein
MALASYRRTLDANGLAASRCSASSRDSAEMIEYPEARAGVNIGIDRSDASRLATTMEPIRFTGTLRYWSAEKAAGLAVVDVPPVHIPALGGLKQARVRGRIAGSEFTSSVMPAGGGRLALSVSRAMMKGAGVEVGEAAEVEITGSGREEVGS